MASRKPSRSKPPPRGTPPLPVPDAARKSGFDLRDEDVEEALVTGAHQGLLEDYFGPEQYAELTRLARDATASRTLRGGPPVLILPGLLGSKLGRKRKLGPFEDVFWFDPLDIGIGRLTQLRLPTPGNDCSALGVMLFAYLTLKFRLCQAGFDAHFHAFDWRRGITELGAELAAVLQQRAGEKVSLVAHSMGGLVARAAIGQGAQYARLVMIGTPNSGSFDPVMAIRATHPVVRKLGALDVRHTPEQLSRDLFTTFPGLTQMLPDPERWAEVDLYDLSQWPPDELHPRDDLLKGVAPMREGLAGARDDFFVICGVDQETTVGLRHDEQGRFVYQTSSQGDGTVPLEFAQLSGAKAHYYVAENHGALPNNSRVARAVCELLDRGHTDALPTRHAPSALRAPVTEVPEAALRVEPYDGRRGPVLSQRELREVPQELVAPTARKDAVSAGPMLPSVAPTVSSAGFRHPFERVVVGRRRQHRLDLRIALGSITEVDARALSVGIFRDVVPAGPAKALDARLGGAITALNDRRMFSRGIGEVFMMPTGRHPLAADIVCFVGLGSFDKLDDSVLQTAAENVMRTFINTRIEEFATVLFGANSGETAAGALRNLLSGFFRGLRDADHDHAFRRLIICEQDPQRFLELKEELYRLSSTSLCEQIELTLDEVVLPPRTEAPPRGEALPRREEPIYLIMRQETATASEAEHSVDIHASLLTSGHKALVVSGLRTIKSRELQAAREAVVAANVQDFSQGGRQLGDLLLSDAVRTVLSRQRGHHLVVVHDAPLSRVPWETLALPLDDGEAVWFPAAEQGLSRRYSADNLSVAKWLSERVEDDVLRVLLVVDPTGDLPGAALEGRRLGELFQHLPGARVDVLQGEEATRPALLAAFSSGRYDVVHFAGHAFFDEDNPTRSGVVCHHHTVLSGADLAGLPNLPTLVFFNACESGRLRRTAGRLEVMKPLRTSVEQLDNTVGLAEALLRGGVANFVGTYWPVGDAAAETFSLSFYRELLRGAGLNAALQAGRMELRRMLSRDWADYLFYGNPDFVLKQRGP
ncbi:alpha/beta fold hydrolase [Corallococcus sp. BB11-1]|uniref:CHAT domain-containing protein n=1 Tax=Corallococcus sp. BB11-1 TaxID=2996783 RepID=UPI0022711E81|nr:CHAT domain-containing protein [Corallococcus sp. BB11-1]MCY1032051.1 alpha/beta fold hydrolase [Corallococcus sp. BB11-1]